jgi:DNA-binding NarL/FixJ family response regulator
VTLRVAIADDHPLFLDGLRLLLATTPDIEVVAAAADGEQLLRALESVDADVIVVDLDMPGLDGAEVARRLVALRPGVPVLVLTMHDDGDSAVRALRAGARGYVLKGAGHGAIVRAVRAVADGDTVLGGASRPPWSRPPRWATYAGRSPSSPTGSTTCSSWSRGDGTTRPSPASCSCR